MEWNKSLEEWTLKECKKLCEEQISCSGCPLARKVCGDYGIDPPYKWPLGG